jgi:hypothetical protein
VSLGRYRAVFLAEIYVILASVDEIQTKAKSEKYVSICSDSQSGSKDPQAAKTKSPLVLTIF